MANSWPVWEAKTLPRYRQTRSRLGNYFNMRRTYTSRYTLWNTWLQQKSLPACLPRKVALFVERKPGQARRQVCLSPMTRSTPLLSSIEVQTLAR